MTQRDLLTLILKKDGSGTLLKLRDSPEEIERRLRRYLKELFG